ELSGHVFQIPMVAQDKGNLHLQFPCLKTAQKVVEAVVVLRNKNRHSWDMAIGVHLPFHPKVQCQFSFKFHFEPFEVDLVLELTLQAHKEDPGLFVHMLVQIDYVPLPPMDEGGYGPNDSRSIGTMDQDAELHNAKLKGKIRVWEKGSPVAFRFL